MLLVGLGVKIQVELMNTGRGREALESDPVALVAQWCRTGPKADQADVLRDRFFKAIDTLAER